jgi:hypothetical protein
LKRTLLLLAAAILFGAPVTALADTFTFQAPATAPNQGSGGAQQFDLDHHSAYTWRIGGVNLAGKTITRSRSVTLATGIATQTCCSFICWTQLEILVLLLLLMRAERQ